MRNDSVYLRRADEDVAAYYTSALALRGQSYDWGSSHDDDHDKGLVDDRYRAELAKLERTRITLWDLEAVHAKALRDIYTPWGTADFRADALRVNWGSGTLARIANHCPLAVEACAAQHGACGADDVSRFLRYRAGEGDASIKFFREVREACERVRSAALTAYRSSAMYQRGKVAA